MNIICLIIPVYKDTKAECTSNEQKMKLKKNNNKMNNDNLS